MYAFNFQQFNFNVHLQLFIVFGPSITSCFSIDILLSYNSSIDFKVLSPAASQPKYFSVLREVLDGKVPYATPARWRVKFGVWGFEFGVLSLGGTASDTYP